MHLFTRAVGTVAATTLVTSGLTGVAAAAAPAPLAGSGTVAEQAAIEEILGLVIDGLGRVGETLKVDRPTGYLVNDWAIQWFRGTTEIPGATDWTYVPVPADAGQDLRARVTGLGLLGVPLVRGVTAALPIALPGGDSGEDPAGELTAAFEAALLRLAGGGLAIQPPTWLLDGQAQAGVQQAVQWFREKAGTTVPIPGATGWDYLPTSADAGSEVFAEITGTLAGLPVVNLVTEHFAVPAQEIVAEVAAAIDSSKGLFPGAVLGAVPPTWNVEEGVTTTYQWQRAGVDIPGADDPTYTIEPDDVEKKLTVVATGAKEGAVTGTSASNAVTAVLGDPAELSASIVGIAAYGRKLVLDLGSWEGPTPGIQWLRNGEPIDGANALYYDVQLMDVASQLSATLTAVRAGSETTTATTPAVTVDRLASRTVVKVGRAKIRKGQAAVLRISTKSLGYVIPGRVTIFDGRKSVKVVRVGSTVKKVRVKMYRTGVHKLRVAHPGNQYVKSSARTVKVKVLRKK